MDNKYKNIKINISYSSNFKPKINNSFNNVLNKNFNKQKKIFCKQFFFILLLLKFIYKKNFIYNTKILLKQKKNKMYTILRAPYRYKLSRHQITLQRFNINFIFYINICKLINIDNIFYLKKYLIFLNNYNIWLESNILNINRIKTNIFFLYRHNFFITKYKK